MTTAVIFLIVLGPMTGLLLWVIVSKLRGVPAFPDWPPPKPGQLDALGRWILGIVWAVIALLAFIAGGIPAVFKVIAAIAALVTFIAVVWTLVESAIHLVGIRKGARAVDSPSSSLAPIHKRFAANFRRTIIELPLFFASFG